MVEDEDEALRKADEWLKMKWTRWWRISW